MLKKLPGVKIVEEELKAVHEGPVVPDTPAAGADAQEIGSYMLGRH